MNSLQTDSPLFWKTSWHIRICQAQLLGWWTTQPQTPSTIHPLCQVTSTASPGSWWDERGKLMWKLQAANCSRREPSALASTKHSGEITMVHSQGQTEGAALCTLQCSNFHLCPWEILTNWLIFYMIIWAASPVLMLGDREGRDGRQMSREVKLKRAN